MPVVKVKGWPAEKRPGAAPEALKQLLHEKAGMDGEETAHALTRLMRGWWVEACFDAGEDGPAQAFLRQVETFGLEAQLQGDTTESWSGSPPRDWFLKYALGVLLGFFLCFWLWMSQPGTWVVKVATVVLLLYTVAVPVAANLHAEPPTESEIARDEKIHRRTLVGVFMLIFLVGLVVEAPRLALALLATLVVGIACAFLIRFLHGRG